MATKPVSVPANVDEVLIDGVRYATVPVPAMVQFRIARKLAPLIAGLAGQLGGANTQTANTEAALQGVLTAIAGMPDDDADALLLLLLSYVRRWNDVGASGQWYPVASGGKLMYEDIPMLSMLKLAGSVVQKNLGGFFSTSGSE